MKSEKLEPFYPFNKLCRELERSGFRLLREPPPFLTEENVTPGEFVVYYFKNLTGVRALAAVRFRPPPEVGGYWSYYSNSVTLHWLKKVQSQEGVEFIPCGVSNRHSFPLDRFSAFVTQLTARRPDTTEMENYNQYFEDVRNAQRRQYERMQQAEQEQRNREMQATPDMQGATGVAGMTGEVASTDDDLAADLDDMKKFVSRISKSK